MVAADANKTQYSREEIAKNNGLNGARTWIILWDCVYDVTDYLNEHPGGAELLGEYAGGDATSGFEDFGHSSDAKKLLKKFEIGVVAKNTNNNNNNDNNNTVSNNNGKNQKEVSFEGDPKIRQKSRQRRKFLSVILGPCASR